ncbi:MAG: serine hydrolase [Candidatus Aminicenantes bacterium]|nr:serine hydrolase [Candidatus Aminicenantes bacterium]
MSKPLPFVFGAASVLVAMTAVGCDAQAGLARQRAKAVERGLLRSVYLQGLRPEPLRLEERMAFYKVPAVSLAAFDKGRLEWTRVYGRRDPQVEAPPTPETMFQAGGLTQLVTAALVLRLVEDGLIGLDEDIRPRLRTWRFPGEFEPGPGGVTLRTLLSHAAGLSDQVLPGYGPDEPKPSLAQILAGDKPAKNGPLWVAPKRSARLEAWLSEAGYVVVQVLLEDLTGRAYPDLVREKIFRPLGLAHSAFGSSLTEDLRPSTAAGFLRQGQAVPGGGATYPEDAAKGLWTTPSDYAAIVLDLLAAAEERPAKLLPPAAARALLRAQVENFGLGFFVEGQGDGIHFRASGTTRGFACTMVVYPTKRQGAVIMTNSDNGDVLIEEILAGFSSAYEWPDYKPVEKPVLRLAQESYADFAGRYEVDQSYVLEVRPEDYYLVITPTGQAPTRFYAEGQTLFYSTDPYVRIQFFRAADGRIESLVLWQKGFRLEARKVLR